MSQTAEAIIAELGESPLMGSIKKKAKAIKKDHDLAYALWGTQSFTGRMLAALIFDKVKLRGEPIILLAKELEEHSLKERDQISDWLLANQLSKDSKLKAQVLQWQDAPSPVLQRWFWYHQGRLRWMGNRPAPTNSLQLIELLEHRLAEAEPSAQWAMNFCLCWIALYEEEFRDRCIKLTKELGLYQDQKVPKNCTPNYLPGFLEVELAKRKKALG